MLVWTDAGGEDRDPILPLSDLPAFSKPWKYGFGFRPTILDRGDWQEERENLSDEPFTSSYMTGQKFHLLHKVYGTTLSVDVVQQDPFYAVKEIYAFAAAAENQFLNMMEQLLSE